MLQKTTYQKQEAIGSQTLPEINHVTHEYSESGRGRSRTAEDVITNGGVFLKQQQKTAMHISKIKLFYASEI